MSGTRNLASYSGTSSFRRWFWNLLLIKNIYFKTFWQSTVRGKILKISFNAMQPVIHSESLTFADTSWNNSVCFQSLQTLIVPINRVSELISPPAVMRCLQSMVFAQSSSTNQGSLLSVVLVNQVILCSLVSVNLRYGRCTRAVGRANLLPVRLASSQAPSKNNSVFVVQIEISRTSFNA